MIMLAVACSAVFWGQWGPASGASDSLTSFQSSDLQANVSVAEPSRLEITPAMRGRIEDEEWDPLVTTSDTKTFFQWEPGIIYVAGSGPAGTDLLLSLDLGGNGWLVGNDNIEARVTTDPSGAATVAVRRLNANNVAGPIWEDLPGWAVASIAKANLTNGRVDYELALTDANLGILPRKPQKIAARVDMIPTQQSPISPTQPRSLTPLELATNRAEGLPSTLKYGVEKLQPAIPGETTNVRFNFMAPKAAEGQPAKKIVISGEGLMQPKLTEMNAPFPPFGGKTKCYIDYGTKVGFDAETGYHILKAVLTLSDDTPATVETSFYVAPVIDVQLQTPKVVSGTQDRGVTVSFAIKSNLKKPMKGSLIFSLDPKFKILNRSNNEERFILEPTGKINRKFQVFVPAGSKGTYPVQFEISANGAKSSVIRYLTFE